MINRRGFEWQGRGIIQMLSSLLPSSPFTPLPLYLLVDGDARSRSVCEARSGVGVKNLFDNVRGQFQDFIKPELVEPTSKGTAQRS